MIYISIILTIGAIVLIVDCLTDKQEPDTRCVLCRGKGKLGKSRCECTYKGYQRRYK